MANWLITILLINAVFFVMVDGRRLQKARKVKEGMTCGELLSRFLKIFIPTDYFERRQRKKNDAGKKKANSPIEEVTAPYELETICPQKTGLSPINIVVKSPIETAISVNLLEFKNSDLQGCDVQVHSMDEKVTMTFGCVGCKTAPKLIEKGTFPDYEFTWNLVALEMLSPSAHTINGNNLILEAQLIYVAASQELLEEAIQYPNSVTVVSILFENKYEDNRALDGFLNALKLLREVKEGNDVNIEEVKEVNEGQEVEGKNPIPNTVESGTFNLNALLPRDHQKTIFYSYLGTLMPVTYTSKVRYFISANFVAISANQAKEIHPPLHKRPMEKPEVVQEDNKNLISFFKVITSVQ